MPTEVREIPLPYRRLQKFGRRAWSQADRRLRRVRTMQDLRAAQKEARLRFLKNYWVDKVRGLPGVKINTPLGNDQSCAIANVLVDGMTPAELVDALWDRYRIFTVGVEQGARIAPNVFTRLSDLDLLVQGIQECAAG